MSTRTSAVRAFDQRRWSEVAPVWALLALLGAGAWIYTVSRARDMGVGPGTMGMAFAFFATMWVAMMAAMMLPAIGPLAAEQGALVVDGASQGTRVSAALAFGAGFLAPWALYGVLAFVAFVGTGHLVDSSPATAKWLGVGIFAVAGLYQFAPIKRRALEHCRTPMAALAVVILGEKLLPDTRTFTMAVGLILIGFAVAAAVHPGLLGGLHPAGGSMPMGGSPAMGGM